MIRARLGALAASALILLLTGSAIVHAQATDEDSRTVFLIRVSPASFDELISIPSLMDLARAGGAALLIATNVLPVHAGSNRDPLPEGVDQIDYIVSAPNQLAAVDDAIRDRVRRFGADEVLVIVLSLEPTSDRMAAHDQVHPIVVAAGSPHGVFARERDPGSLTSDTTRRSGVVTDADVVATIRAHLGLDFDVGSRIEQIGGPPPYDLYDRYLAQRRLYVPIGTAAALYVTGAGVLAIGLLAWGERAPVAWRRVMGWASLSVAMLATGLLAAGHLPELSYATAVPMVAIVTVFGTMAFSPLERAETTLVPFGIGVAVLVAFVLEAASGWSGMLTPLLGGSQLDGGRFYGLPNVALGLLVGSCLWVAHRLGTLAGFALLCGAGLFAGLPFLGADLGGAVTSFAAAGLWVAVRERDRPAIAKGAAVTVAVTAIGTALILVSHAFSPFETHVTRFESDRNGLGGTIGTLVERLEAGFDLIARNPAALIPVVGLPIALFVALRPPSPIRATFQRWPAWRDAVVVTFVAGIVAYLVNDTGPAAAGLFFGLGLGGMVGVSLLAPTGKMEAE